jgi:ComF family protein
MAPMKRLVTAARRYMPTSCELCLQQCDGEINICHRCRPFIVRGGQHCISCALPLPVNLAEQMPRQCGQCLAQPPSLDRCFSLCDYTTVAAALIQAIKYQQRKPVTKMLSQLLAESLRHQYRQDSLPTLIIPVPLHRLKLFYRGFNPAQQIAYIVGRELAIKSDVTLIKKIHATPDQHGLNKKQRRQNLNNAFSGSTQLQRFCHIAIIDDVVTTGTTANTIATLAKKHGVKRVDCWSLARTPSPG